MLSLLFFFAATLPLSHAQIQMGRFSYTRSAAYCKANPAGVAWWFDHSYTRRWVHSPCSSFVKAYKPLKPAKGYNP